MKKINRQKLINKLDANIEQRVARDFDKNNQIMALKDSHNNIYWFDKSLDE